MKECPKEYFYAVERVLREYPERERELRMLDRFIAECCHAVSPDAEPSGLSVKIPSSPQEKIVEVKEENNHYRWLTRFVALVREGLEKLSPEEELIVECLFWRGQSIQETSWVLNMSRASVFRTKDRALQRLAPIFIPTLIPEG